METQPRTVVPMEEARTGCLARLGVRSVPGWGRGQQPASTLSLCPPDSPSSGPALDWGRAKKVGLIMISLGSETCTLCLARERGPQQKDRWSKRPMHSWGQFDCKEGGTWKERKK